MRDHSLSSDRDSYSRIDADSEQNDGSDFEANDNGGYDEINVENTGLELQSKRKRGRTLSRTYNRQTNKKRRQLGLQHETCKRIRVKERKTLKDGCGLRCKLRCHQKLNQAEREEQFHSYWRLGCITQQRAFIAANVSKKATHRKTTMHASRRSKTLIYHLKLNDEDHHVCKTFFTHTLGITEQAIKTAMSKRGPSGTIEPEKRGKKDHPKHDIFSEMRNEVMLHICRLPLLPSHYMRADSNRLYLPPDFSKRKCYDLYLSEKADNLNEVVSFSTYAKIFESLNISIHNPKKDACSKCEIYKNKTAKSAEDNRQHEEHLIRKNEVRLIKKAKEDAMVFDNTAAFVFDFQAQLPCPKGDASLFYYSRKLNCFNFTIFDLGTGAGTCSFWHEGQAGKGPNEVCTCLHAYLHNLDTKESLKKVYAFSDATASQNRNYIVASMLLQFIRQSEHVEECNLIFFESGHSQNEGDSMHSVIERSSRHLHIYTPEQWVGVIKSANRRKPYIVNELSSTQILDWRAVQNSTLPNKLSFVSGDPMLISNMKWLRFTKPGVFEATDTFNATNLQQIQTGRFMRSIVDPKAQCRKANAVSVEKKKDLWNLCTQNLIPQVHHEFYKKLKGEEDIHDTIEGLQQ